MKSTLDPRERRFELALREELGSEPVPDLRYRILASLQRGSGLRAVYDRPARGRSWRTALVAAAIAYALAIVTTIAWGAQDESRTATQDPVRELRPKTTDELRDLLSKATGVSVRAGLASVERMLGLPKDASVAVFLSEKERAEFVQDVAVARVEEVPEFDFAYARIDVHLADGKLLRGAIHMHQLDRIVFGEVGAMPLPQKSSRLLRAAIAESETRSRRMGGIIVDIAELQVEGPAALPRGLPSLHLLDGTDADLAAVGEFTELEHLDISGAASNLTDETLEQLLRLPRLRSLVLSPDQAIGRIDMLAESKVLRRFGLSVIEMEGLFDRAANCAACHMPAAPAPRRVALPAGLARALPELAPLEHLAIQGLELPTEVSRALEHLPTLESLDLRECDLRDLDVAALRKLPLLRSLNLAGAKGADARFLEAISSVKSLRRIDMRRTVEPGPSADDIRQLRQAIPQSEVLWVETDRR